MILLGEDNPMSRINGWKRQHWFSNLETAQDELDHRGRVELAAWRHTDLGTKLAHIWEPEAEKPFIVRIDDPDVSREEEGRYATRGEGGTANKELMRNYP